MFFDPNRPTWWIILIAAALGILAILGAIRAMFTDRANGRARCPHCRYDLSGNTGDRCTECGFRWKNQAELYATHRHPWIAAAWLLLAVPGLFLITLQFREPLRRVWYALPPRWLTQFTMSSGDVRVVALRQRDPLAYTSKIEVRYKNQVFFEWEDGRVDVGFDHASNRYKRVFTDLNRDGIEELFVYGYSGGAHCCWTYAIIEITDPPRIVAHFSATSGIAAVEREGDEALFNIPDTAFDYWRASFVDSPRIPVMYRLINGHLEIAIDAMLTPRPSPDDAQWLKSATEFRTAKAPDPRMWEMMLLLAYGGHEDLCWRFLDDSWPAGVDGKEDFIREFNDILKTDSSWRNFSAALKAHREHTTQPPAIMPLPM
ncbi:MAG: hypothetical protein ACK54H_09865 [Phycisphaerales bacterium]